jgi:SAGA-associated factor 11
MKAVALTQSLPVTDPACFVDLELPDPVPGARGPTDVFGQTHPPSAMEQITCMKCGRKVAAGRFAPHLEKCLGGGRQSSRQATRRGAG